MEEGQTATLRCSLSYSNPASKLIWQNDTAQFSPPTPAVITKPSVLTTFTVHLRSTVKSKDVLFLDVFLCYQSDRRYCNEMVIFPDMYN